MFEKAASRYIANKAVASESDLRELAKIKNADARILKEFHTAAMDLKKLGAKQSIIDDMIERYHAASIKILDNTVKTKEELGY